MNRAILVKSCQKNRDRQEAILETWKAAMPGVNLWFVEGRHAQPRIQLHKIKTITGDDYADNSVKLRDALSLILEPGYMAPEDFRLFIVDDDTFVHPKRWLAHEPQGEFECQLYYPRTPKERKLNYNRPWANGGAGWWMSRRMCELYVEHVTQRCSWDDVLATRVAQDHRVPITDRPDLYSDKRYTGEEWPAGAITCHPVEPDEMRKLWEGLTCTV